MRRRPLNSGLETGRETKTNLEFCNITEDGRRRWRLHLPTRDAFCAPGMVVRCSQAARWTDVLSAVEAALGLSCGPRGARRRLPAVFK